MGRHGAYNKSIAYLESYGIYTIRYGIGMGLGYMDFTKYLSFPYQYPRNEQIRF